VLDEFVRAVLTQYAQTELAVGHCFAKTQDDCHEADLVMTSIGMVGTGHYGGV
jgi:hypothetical protein